MKQERNDFPRTDGQLEFAPEITETESGRVRSILLKHDYYSEDSEYGWDLLETIISALNDSFSMIGRVILVGSAVELLRTDSMEVRDLLTCNNGGDYKVYVSEGSVERYQISPDCTEGMVTVSDIEIAEMIISDPDILILE